MSMTSSSPNSSTSSSSTTNSRTEGLPPIPAGSKPADPPSTDAQDVKKKLIDLMTKQSQLENEYEKILQNEKNLKSKLMNTEADLKWKIEIINEKDTEIRRLKAEIASQLSIIEILNKTNFNFEKKCSNFEEEIKNLKQQVNNLTSLNEEMTISQQQEEALHKEKINTLATRYLDQNEQLRKLQEEKQRLENLFKNSIERLNKEVESLRKGNQDLTETVKKINELTLGVTAKAA